MRGSVRSGWFWFNRKFNSYPCLVLSCLAELFNCLLPFIRSVLFFSGIYWIDVIIVLTSAFPFENLYFLMKWTGPFDIIHSFSLRSSTFALILSICVKSLKISTDSRFIYFWRQIFHRTVHDIMGASVHKNFDNEWKFKEEKNATHLCNMHWIKSKKLSSSSSYNSV